MSTVPNVSIDARHFIGENAFQTAYWPDVAREAATIREDALLAYATRKATSYVRAFAGAAKDMPVPNEGAAR